jgi:DNA replication and repair protein RecF
MLAERVELASVRGAAPLLLLDDVMSELDAARRGRLVEVLRGGGQSVVTATELSHIPGADEPGVERVAIAEGRVLQEAERAEGPVTVATDGDGPTSPHPPGRMKAVGTIS